MAYRPGSIPGPEQLELQDLPPDRLGPEHWAPEDRDDPGDRDLRDFDPYELMREREFAEER